MMSFSKNFLTSTYFRFLFSSHWSLRAVSRQLNSFRDRDPASHFFKPVCVPSEPYRDFCQLVGDISVHPSVARNPYSHGIQLFKVPSSQSPPSLIPPSIDIIHNRNNNVYLSYVNLLTLSTHTGKLDISLRSRFHSFLLTRIHAKDEMTYIVTRLEHFLLSAILFYHPALIEP